MREQWIRHVKRTTTTKTKGNSLKHHQQRKKTTNSGTKTSYNLKTLKLWSVSVLKYTLSLGGIKMVLHLFEDCMEESMPRCFFEQSCKLCFPRKADIHACFYRNLLVLLILTHLFPLLAPVKCTVY